MLQPQSLERYISDVKKYIFTAAMLRAVADVQNEGPHSDAVNKRARDQFDACIKALEYLRDGDKWPRAEIDIHASDLHVSESDAAQLRQIAAHTSEAMRKASHAGTESEAIDLAMHALVQSQVSAYRVARGVGLGAAYDGLDTPPNASHISTSFAAFWAYHALAARAVRAQPPALSIAAAPAVRHGAPLAESQPGQFIQNSR